MLLCDMGSIGIDRPEIRMSQEQLKRDALQARVVREAVCRLRRMSDISTEDTGHGATGLFSPKSAVHFR